MEEKIVFVTNRLGGGGSERVLVTLANYIADKGYDVSIISYKNSEEYNINKKIKLYILEEQRNKLFRIINIRKIFKQVNPKTIISFEYFVNMQTILARLGLKNKLIISERNDPSRVGNDKKYLRDFLYKFADVLVCQTNDAKEYFPEGIQRKSLIILNPIKENLPQPWNGERNKEIVNFCRLEKQKNLPLLIDAFEKVHNKYPDYKLTIYGDGSEKENLINHINKKNLNKYVTLHSAEKDIHPKVLNSAMFVSSSDYEGLSNSMLEAMAIGLPTIVTDCPCGGARMVIENNVNGILVPVGDYNEIAKSMIMLIEDKEKADEISKNGTKIRNRLSTDKIASEWEKIL